MFTQSPKHTLFPYTTLFRSKSSWVRNRCARFNSGLISGIVTVRELVELATDVLLFPRNQRSWTCRPPKTPPQTKQIVQSKLRSEEHTSELQSLRHLVCRLLL